MSIHMLYITANDANEARSIGSALLERKLVACVNIMDTLESLYEWEGNMNKGHEVVLIAKTTEEKLDAITSAVQEHCSYDCPCILTWPVRSLHAQYEKWVCEQVA